MIRVFENEKHAEFYAGYRPEYPTEVTNEIINYAKAKSKRTEKLEIMVDIGCGTGKSTKMFHKYATNIIAIDPSESQIKQAKLTNAESNITYVVGQAEQIPVGDNTVDLICAGISIHWVDFDKFWTECRRVLKQDGSVALYGYHPPIVARPGDEADSRTSLLISELRSKCIWHERNSHVEDKYTRIFDLIPTEDKKRNDDFKIDKVMSLQDFLLYISTWSGYQRYLTSKISAEKEDILDTFAMKLKTQWKINHLPNERVMLRVTWEVFILLSGSLD